MGHLTALRLANFALALLAMGTAAAVVHTWTMPVMNGEGGEVGLAWLGGLGGMIFAGLGLAHVVVGLALGRGRGRGLQTLLALALIVTFPIGTVYALYALWVCWANPTTRRHLGDDAPASSALVLSAVPA
ncbi:MAG: hypothetical protein H6722_02375 [Sandaracinus sp.]|nr:hypothetical protein [Sandaracinus sp.]MCB9611281.1 hypothetical protein [Sandaracinus sp.]MCB9620342.1 hypothetical protein [Sandaracinus sp.]MCB9624455.1 hypothetical protein [Sandaracinus sp.]